MAKFVRNHWIEKALKRENYVFVMGMVKYLTFV